MPRHIDGMLLPMPERLVSGRDRAADQSHGLGVVGVVVVAAVFSSVGAALLFGGGYLLLWIKEWLLSRTAREWHAAAIGIGVLVVGLGFFLFRKKAPVRYGLVEIGFGVASAVYAALNASLSQLTTSFGLSMAAAIYLVVRGADNVSKGLDALEGKTEKERIEHLEHRVDARIAAREGAATRAAVQAELEAEDQMEREAADQRAEEVRHIY